MDKVKDMMHGGHKEGEHTTPTTTGGYAGETGTGYGQTTEGGHEKKGLFGLGGHKKEGEEGEKKHGFMGMGGDHGSSSSSSDEEREGARERNRLRRERRAQRQQAGVGSTDVTTAVPQ